MTDQAMLVVEGGPDQDETTHFLVGTTTVGRQPDNDVVVAETGVSRWHAEIVETNGGYNLRDLKSTNGTFVNSKKIAEGDHLLKDGDEIRLGAAKASLVFRSHSASTLQMTLVQSVVTDVGEGALSAVVEAKEPATAPQSAEAGAVAEEAAKPAEEELYEGTVRLNVQAQGNMGLMVSFVQALRERPDLRILRMANNRKGGTDIWLTLRQPVPLRDMLGEVGGVAGVSPTQGPDPGAEGEETPLSVFLRANGQAPSESTERTPCVNCKELLDPGTAVCPHCRKTQT